MAVGCVSVAGREFAERGNHYGRGKAYARMQLGVHQKLCTTG